MSIQKYQPEQIVAVLRQIEVQIANGKTAPQACKEAGIHTQTYYRWRKEYGGLKLEQAKRLKELEKENSRLKRLVADVGAAGWHDCPTDHMGWFGLNRCNLYRRERPVLHLAFLSSSSESSWMYSR